MRTRHTLAAALMATTLMAGSFASLAANHAYAAAEKSGLSAKEQASIDSDAQKMSRDALIAFTDVSHARLSIFDGDPPTAKKLVQEARDAFDRAKTDRSVFTKAEADFQPARADKDAKAASADRTAEAQAKTPVAWLPVDGAVVMNEDFTAHPAKKAAVADANKKLANGDRKGAMEKLKLADVDVDYVIAVVPLKQTMDEIGKANKLMQEDKYYETSQILKQIEESVRYDSLNVRATPTAAHANAAGTDHAAKTTH